MSNIRRHLPAIVGIIREHIATGADDDPSAYIKACCHAITALLPASYNAVPHARLIDAHGTLTPPIDILILNQALPAKTQRLPPNTWLAARAVAAIMVGQSWSCADLCHATRVISQVKAVQASLARPILGLLCVQRYLEQQGETSAARCQAIAAVLQQPPEQQRVDGVFVFADAVRYQHPAPAGQRAGDATINFAREREAVKARTCYICKTKFTRLHPFYDRLCIACGDANYLHRQALAVATGRIALVTGGRVGIGYQVVLRLLRAGAQVIATTRFPRLAAQQFAAEPDCAAWQDRLQLYALDLRHIPLLARFIQHIAVTYPHLDILVNNAAQTVRQSPAYHAALSAQEHALAAALPLATQRMVSSALVAEPPSLAPLLYGEPAASFAEVATENSWQLRVGDPMNVIELLETQVINVTAPYLLINRLLPLLQRSPQHRRFIVNVTAVEGQFASKKHGVHPHTNMAKAALNMLTHTVAADLATSGIYLNSVDPGWISHQGVTKAASLAAAAGDLPLDAVDGAARVCAPIFAGMAASTPSFGKLFKDYQEVAW